MFADGNFPECRFMGYFLIKIFLIYFGVRCLLISILLVFVCLMMGYFCLVVGCLPLDIFCPSCWIFSVGKCFPLAV